MSLINLNYVAFINIWLAIWRFNHLDFNNNINKEQTFSKNFHRFFEKIIFRGIVFELFTIFVFYNNWKNSSIVYLM